MNRAVLATAAAAIIAAAGIGFIAGAKRPTASAIAMVDPAAAEEGRATIYFRDPDGKPSYSLTPMKTQDGRDYRAVPADADVGFEDAAAETPSVSASPGAEM